jgi:hypothetical protein
MVKRCILKVKGATRVRYIEASDQLIEDLELAAIGELPYVREFETTWRKVFNSTHLIRFTKGGSYGIYKNRCKGV